MMCGHHSVTSVRTCPRVRSVSTRPGVYGGGGAPRCFGHLRLWCTAASHHLQYVYGSGGPHNLICYVLGTGQLSSHNWRYTGYGTRTWVRIKETTR